MDIIAEIIMELIVGIFDVLIRSKTVPKPVKYIIVTLVSAFIIGLFILALINVKMLIAKIFFGLLAAAFVIVYIVLLRKIHRNEINDDL